jgi:hypothetical protein
VLEEGGVGEEVLGACFYGSGALHGGVVAVWIKGEDEHGTRRVWRGYENSEKVEVEGSLMATLSTMISRGGGPAFQVVSPPTVHIEFIKQKYFN